jgi:hypothetical protein
MDNQRSRFARPVTAMQLAMIIWLPIILAGLGWMIVTSFQDSERQAVERNKATEAAKIRTARACRELRNALASQTPSQGQQQIEAPKCD